VRSTRRPARLAALLGSLSLAAALSPSAALASGEDEGTPIANVDCAETIEPATPAQPAVVSDVASAPLEQMRIEEAQEVATGAGVTVAVVDAVVAPVPQIPSLPGEDLVGGGITLDHGTVVAGIIAGADRVVEGQPLPVGVAPDARILPVRIVGAVDPEDQAAGLPPFGTDVVVEALRRVEARADEIDIVNLSFNTGPTPELRDAIEAVQRAGVIVVAATANRDPDVEMPEPGGATPIPVQDQVFPASYPGVLGVTTYTPIQDDNGEPVAPETFITASPAIDVAVPSQNGVSYGPNGSSCVLFVPATSWATAYASGVLALLVEEYGDEESPEEIVARLVDTASGVPDQRSVITGAGVVQPMEALTREVDTDSRGAPVVPEQVDDADGGQAQPPPIREDELAQSRDDFRWWGLLAGAVLVGAVILRPLLRRIRRS